MLPVFLQSARHAEAERVYVTEPVGKHELHVSTMPLPSSWSSSCCGRRAATGGGRDCLSMSGLWLSHHPSGATSETERDMAGATPKGVESHITIAR